MSEPRTLRTHPELASHRSFPTFRSVGDGPRSPLERFLSLFADVRSGEGLGALLLAANVFLLLATYYLLKTVREQLILSEGGAEVKVYASAAQAALLLIVVPVYGWLSTKVARMRLVAITTSFFAVNLVLFSIAGTAGANEGIAFYIWLGIFNMFVVSQFWAFANDIYTEGQGRRLFPFIGVGSSLGAWLGAAAVVQLVDTVHMTPYTIMLLSAILLVLCLGLTAWVHRLEGQKQKTVDPAAARAAEAPLGDVGAFALIRRTPYLFWIAILTVLLNVVNTSGEFILSKLVVDAASAAVPDGSSADVVGARQEFIGVFYGSFFSWVNLLGLVLQLFVTSRVMRIFGVRGTMFILPIIALVNYAVIAVAPLLAVVRMTKALENSTDYSIQNTVRQALFLPTSREAKYKAKTAIDTLGSRFGDMVQAGIVRVGTTLGASVTAFAWLNVGLTVVWLLVAGRIAREHRKQTL